MPQQQLSLAELDSRFRSIVDDNGKRKPLWSQTEVVGYANRVINDICRQARVIHDGTSVSETVATGTIVLDGAAGQIDSVSVNGVTVTSTAVPFDTDLDTTSAALAANIAAHTSDPDYSASSDEEVVTVSAASNTGSTPNGYEITVVCSGGMAATVSDMSGGSCIARLFIVPGQQHYRKDPRIIDIEDARLTILKKTLTVRSWRDFAADDPDWEISTGDPSALCVDFSASHISLDTAAVSADVARLRVVRLPLSPLVAWSDSPEIPAEYHDFIPEMMCRYAYDKKDTQTLDPQSVKKYYDIGYNLQNPESYMNQIMNAEQRKSPLRRPVGNGGFF